MMCSGLSTPLGLSVPATPPRRAAARPPQHQPQQEKASHPQEEVLPPTACACRQRQWEPQQLASAPQLCPTQMVAVPVEAAHAGPKSHQPQVAPLGQPEDI